MTKINDAPYKVDPPVSRELYEENMRNRMAFRSPGAKVPSALDVQVAGDHYKNMAIQPVQYIHRNGLSYLAGNVVKYISRHKVKGGVDDVRKAIHYCNLILELEYGDVKKN